MVVLGIASPFVHDPSAAVLVDGELIAAADEERFIRKKHARGKLPINAINFCLKQAGLRPDDIRHVAYPWSDYEYLNKLPMYVGRTWRTRQRPFRLSWGASAISIALPAVTSGTPGARRHPVNRARPTASALA